ncbi:CHC2 zinc finger domain-containing protein [Candidatus Vidania fulgoroideorum]
MSDFFIRKNNVRKWMKCPFHKEKNPSLLINKNYYYCFGCKKYGNLFKISKKNILEKFFYVLKKQNDKYQVIKIFSRRKILYKNFFSRYNIISINNNINVKIFSKKELSILIKKKFFFNNFNKYYVYLNKLIIPIRDLNGNLLTFVVKKKKPKYLFFNKIKKYKKNNLLYGYYENLKNIRKSNKIFVVEGFFDVFRLNLIGIKNVVSLMGCNISKFQINYLINLKKDIYFILDNDSAGKNSLINFSIKNYKICLKNIFIYFIKIKKDPDVFFENYNKDQFFSYILKKKKNIIDFLYLKFFYKIKNFFFKNFKKLYEKMEKKNKRSFVNDYINIIKKKIINIKKKKIFYIYYKKIKKKILYNKYILYIIKYSLKKKNIIDYLFNYFKNYKNKISKIIIFKKKLYKKIFEFFKIISILKNE